MTKERTSSGPADRPRRPGPRRRPSPGPARCSPATPPTHRETARDHVAEDPDRALQEAGPRPASRLLRPCTGMAGRLGKPRAPPAQADPRGNESPDFGPGRKIPPDGSAPWTAPVPRPSNAADIRTRKGAAHSRGPDEFRHEISFIPGDCSPSDVRTMARIPGLVLSPRFGTGPPTSPRSSQKAATPKSAAWSPPTWAQANGSSSPPSTSPCFPRAERGLMPRLPRPFPVGTVSPHPSKPTQVSAPSIRRLLSAFLSLVSGLFPRSQASSSFTT